MAPIASQMAEVMAVWLGHGLGDKGLRFGGLGTSIRVTHIKVRAKHV